MLTIEIISLAIVDVIMIVIGKRIHMERRNGMLSIRLVILKGMFHRPRNSSLDGSTLQTNYLISKS